MSGETELGKLLVTLQPVLLREEFVFLTFADGSYGERSHLRPIVSVRESEGLSLVVPRARADEEGLAYESVFRAITLNVHSSLQAVGLTAVVARALADRGISANVVAGFFHDHVFVPVDRSEEALAAIASLSRSRLG
ncbi:ACT domain-containing protein [Pelagicoccus sp. NFK12]|uniref:ACT domain-containing protein n=1 Tax=Pelagicoccus enzymogenes TaxID=2773457 RepID=A0A927IJL4_9BACT|nr:ACT domain-containing protein [Pelagicoccus enzymogenes]MBD5781665.1 ACT domain-containing protein [Pelagicoccus enzymogenes]